jgi:hypothetical protein
VQRNKLTCWRYANGNDIKKKWIQNRNNKLYIMEESCHSWLKYTCRMCKVCLFISFFTRLFHV